MSYGPRLKAHRENKGEGQTAVASRMKITQSEVSRFEKGEPKRPTAEQFRSLAYGYELPLVTVLMYAGYLTERDVREWESRDTTVTADGPDDLIALAEQIAALTDRLTRLANERNPENRERPSRTSAGA